MDASLHVVRDELERLHRNSARTILASLIRLLGDFDVAEEAVQEAFACALEKWPREGVPRNPRSWLIGVGRHRGLDILRRAARIDHSLDPQLAAAGSNAQFDEVLDAVPDDDLRLIFTCCHPALSLESRIALTLREVCGLSTEEIARAFLSNSTTIAQRIVRAKNKIRQAGISFEVPSKQDLPDRLEGVLNVVYLVFNEGYVASSGEALIRSDLSREAIRLGELVSGLTQDSEAYGLSALMLIQDSRSTARVSASGELITLENQDRSLWDAQKIEQGKEYLSMAVATGEIGTYSIQAAIAAVHADAKSAEDTDWSKIVSLYDLLLRANPSPVVELNRSVAVAMADGLAEGLRLMNSLHEAGFLKEYPLLHSSRADILRRMGRKDEATEAYQLAMDLTQPGPEQRFLATRLAECRAK